MPHRLKLPRTYWADRSLLALLVGASAWLALSIGRGPTEIAPVWVGNGILVGWLLSRPTRRWPGYLLVGFVAELVARALAGDRPLFVLAFTTWNLSR